MSCTIKVVKATPSVFQVEVPSPARVVVEGRPTTGPQGPPGNGSIIVEQLTGTSNGVLAAFSTSQAIAAGSAIVWINGLAQRPTIDFTTTGNVVTFVEPPEAGDYLMISYSVDT